MSRCLLPGLLILLMLPTASAVPYLQAGADAGYTGAVQDPGPEHLEIALELQLPGEQVPGAPVIILDRTVYVLTRAFVGSSLDDPRPDLSENALWQVNVDTGVFEPLLTFEERPTGLASDGHRFFVTTQTAVEAFAIDGGDPLWRVDDPAGDPTLAQAGAEARPGPGPEREVVCSQPAVSRGLLLVACGWAIHDEGPGDGQSGGTAIFSDLDRRGASPAILHALDPATGEVRWRFSTDTPAFDAQRCTENPGRCIELPRGAALPWRLTHRGDLVSMGTRAATDASTTGLDDSGSHDNLVWHINATDGSLITLSDAADERTYLFTDGSDESASKRGHYNGAVPFLSTEQAFIRSIMGVQARDKPDLSMLWEWVPPGSSVASVPGAPTGVQFQKNRLAQAGDTLYYVDADELFALKTGDLPRGEQRLLWNTEVAGEARSVATGDILVAGNRIFTVAEDPPVAEPDVFLGVLSTIDGATLWTYPLTDRHAEYSPMTMGIGDGLWALMSWQGNLTIVGRTEASITVAADVPTAYPAPGERFEVDLSDTAPGLLSPELAYAVDWGDGTRTAWQTDPVFNHTYEEASEVTALLQARNPQGQYATQAVTFDVGGSEPNLIESAFTTAFARDNQDLTFGVLGIAVAVIGGLIAIGRRRRKRGILQRELDAIEQAYAMTREDPRACTEALAERRVHCRGLLLDGKADEGQYAILEKRIEELSGKVRLGVLDERFDYLPLGMVRRLEQMLADGQVSTWEREHFEQVLGQDRFLTEAQKGEVRALVDAWFSDDAGVAEA